MTRSTVLLAVGLSLFAAAAVAAEGGTLHTREAMVDGVNPAALAIWDVTNAAIDDEGGLDAEMLDAEAWGKIEDAARMLEAYGNRMAQAQTIVAGGPDLVSGEVPPGVASREQIQAMIDADPDGFRAVSGEMAAQAAALAVAARARDATVAGDLAFGIDAACQACHTRYWFLQEPAQN